MYDDVKLAWGRTGGPWFALQRTSNLLCSSRYERDTRDVRVSLRLIFKRFEQLSDTERSELAGKLLNEHNCDHSLVSPVEPIEVLLHEYANNRPFYVKVKWLKEKSDIIGLRRMKGDGNCFYRAFGFAYISTVLSMNDRPLHHFASQHLDSTLNLLKQAGFEEEVVKDFFEPFRKLMSQIYSTDPATTPLNEKLLIEAFNDPEKSNSIVAYLRMLNANDYTPFLVSATNDDTAPSMEEFCNRDVEAFGKDADHLQITALCTALKASLDVVYLSSSHAPPEEDPLGEDAEAGSQMPGNENVAPETDPNACDVVRFDIEQGHIFGIGPLLYRPGHFDLLVAKAKPESPDPLSG